MLGFENQILKFATLVVYIKTHVQNVDFLTEKWLQMHFQAFTITPESFRSNFYIISSLRDLRAIELNKRIKSRPHIRQAEPESDEISHALTSTLHLSCSALVAARIARPTMF